MDGRHQANGQEQPQSVFEPIAAGSCGSSVAASASSFLHIQLIAANHISHAIRGAVFLFVFTDVWHARAGIIPSHLGAAVALLARPAPTPRSLQRCHRRNRQRETARVHNATDQSWPQSPSAGRIARWRCAGAGCVSSHAMQDQVTAIRIEGGIEDLARQWQPIADALGTDFLFCSHQQRSANSSLSRNQSESGRRLHLARPASIELNPNWLSMQQKSPLHPVASGPPTGCLDHRSDTRDGNPFFSSIALKVLDSPCMGVKRWPTRRNTTTSRRVLLSPSLNHQSSNTAQHKTDGRESVSNGISWMLGQESRTRNREEPRLKLRRSSSG